MKVSITRSKLDALAVAVSAKSGEELPLTIDEMRAAVNGIETGGGSATITDEPNSTGITCVITTGGEPTPTPPTPEIPIGVQLIDFAAVTNDMAINSSGAAVAEQWYSVSDYTEVDPSMTFSYSGVYWSYIGLYDSSKNAIGVLYMMNDGTQRQGDPNYCDGTLTPAKFPAGTKYVRITSTANPTSTYLSLIRTA